MVKFEDIEKYIELPNYHVDVGLSYLEDYLEHWRSGMGLDMTPDFQRGHIWNTKQRAAYMEFFIRGGMGSNIILWNCPSITHNSKGGDLDNKLVLVDGLQRLTTVRMFLDNKLKVFGHHLSEYEDADNIVKDIVRYRFHMHINNLNRRADLLRWYIELNQGGVRHSKAEIDRVKGLLDEEQRARQIA